MLCAIFNYKIVITLYVFHCDFYRRGPKFSGFPEISEKWETFSEKKIRGKFPEKKFRNFGISENLGKLRKNFSEFLVFYKTRSAQQSTRR